MPVIELHKARLNGLYHSKKYEELKDMLPFIGLDIESDDGNTIRVEYSPNRPDFSTDYGIIRALKGLFGDQLGRPRHKLMGSGVNFVVDKSTRGLRPYIAGFVAEHLNLNDGLIKQLISMQEDLHHGIGRERKKVAIGYHDLSVIKSPIQYTTVDLNHKFVPLGATAAMKLSNVLKETRQGVEYGHLLGGFKRAPALIDDAGTTLSIPPIINGAATTVTTNTSRLLVDITGTDLDTIKYAASIIAEALWDAGGVVKAANVIYSPSQHLTYPDIAGRPIDFDPKYARNLLGININLDETILALRKCRNDAKKEGDILKVIVPNYRIDIIHPIDVVEEVAYGYGYFNINPDFNFPYTTGNASAEGRFEDKIRDIMIGLGFSEVITPILTSYAVLVDKMGRNAKLRCVEFSKSAEHACLRDTILPGILNVIALNSDEQNPQAMFELGPVINNKEEKALAAAIKFGDFSKIKSNLVALLNCFDANLSFDRSSIPYMLRGGIIKNWGMAIGEIGEVNPQVLENFGIDSPVAFFELKVGNIRIK